MSSVHELTAADLRHSRLHLFWIQVLFTVVVGGLLLAEIILVPDSLPDVMDRAPLGSLPYLLVGLQITALVLLLAVWFVPIATLMWMAPSAWLFHFGGSELPNAWRLVAVACILALVWVGIRTRGGQPVGPSRRPPTAVDYDESWAYQPALPGWIGVGSSLALTAGLLVAHQFALVQTRDFEDRAEQTLAEVVSYDDGGSDMVVRIGEREVTLEEPEWERPDVGGRVPVLMDADDAEHVVLLAAVDDPSWWVGLAAAAPLVGVWWGLPIILRARRRRGLASRGAPARLVRLASSEDGTFRLQPTDADVPVLHVVNLAGLVPGADVAAFLDDFDGESDDSDEDFDDAEADGSGSLPESDADLALWADEVMEMWEAIDEEDEMWVPSFSDMPDGEKLMVEADFGPDVKDGEPFVMLGSLTHGSSVMLLRGSGQGWMAEINEPRFAAGRRPQFARNWSSMRKPDSEPTASEEVTPPGRFTGLKEAAAVWAHRRTPWLRWAISLGIAALAVVLLPLVVWSSVEEGLDVFEILRLASFILTAAAAPTIAVMATCSMGTGRSRRGLVSYGLVFDEIIAPHRLVSVIPGRDALALRLREPEDALMVAPEDVGDDLEPYGAAREVETWFSSAPVEGRGGRLPSPNLIATILIVVVAAVALLVFLT